MNLQISQQIKDSFPNLNKYEQLFLENYYSNSAIPQIIKATNNFSIINDKVLPLFHILI